MKNKWKVYIHKNKINYKKYVGITSGVPQKRWQNGTGYPNNKHFTSAINKYGWDNFEHIILFDRLEQEEAMCIEKELIKYFKLNKREFGYNKDNGGNGVGRFTEETRKIMSDKKKKAYLGKGNPFFGKHHTDATKQKIRESGMDKFSGDKNPFFGKCHTDETKRKISEANKGRPSSLKGKKVPKEIVDKMKKNSKRVSIICLENGKIFDSMGDCAREMGLGVGNISKVCRGKIKKTGGFSFKIIGENF